MAKSAGGRVPFHQVRIAFVLEDRHAMVARAPQNSAPLDPMMMPVGFSGQVV
jgi:hypothetical protein